MTNPRNYYRPQTLTEALQLAGQPDTVALAGGAMTLDTLDVSFSTFVDLQDVPELKKIEAGTAGYTIGGAVTLQQVVDLPDLHPVIRRSLTRAIPLNHRNGTSVAESLLNPQRFSEWLAVLSAWDAGIQLTFPDGTSDTRSLAAMLQGWDERKLGDGIITAVNIFEYPERKYGLGASFVARTPADDPIVCAAIYISLEADGKIRVVYPVIYGISSEPVINICANGTFDGASVNELTVDSLIQSLKLNSTYSDYRGSAEYRGEMAKVCLKRAMLECMEQLKQA